MRSGTGFLSKQRLQRKKRRRRLWMLGGFLALLICVLLMNWLISYLLQPQEQSANTLLQIRRHVSVESPINRG